MTDAVMVFPAGFRLTDAAGDVVSGGKLKFYNAGGLVTRTVYSNSGLSSSLGTTVFTGSDGLPVANSGSSTEVSVYTGTTAYKIVFTTSADVEIWTLDNLLGALDTSTFLTTSSTSTLSIPVTSKTSNYTIVAADRGKLVQGNPSGGNFTLTLDAAATLGDGWNVEVRNSSVTTGQVIIAASQAIAFEGQTFTTRALQIGEAMAIRCDGTGFKVASHTPPLMSSRNPSVITIADRVTADPGAPTPGARYIVTAAYGSYATHDIIEANNVSFNKYTPAADCGWIAYVQDEDIYYFFRGSAWAAETATNTQQGTVKVSTQASMETGTATDEAALVGHIKNAPGVAKAWTSFNGSGTPGSLLSHNLTSITDNGVGDWTLNLSITFSSTSYAAIGSVRGTADDACFSLKVGGTQTATALRITAFLSNASANDATAVNVAFFGDL